MPQPTYPPKPIILLAFANDRLEQGYGYLPRLTEELRRVRDALEPAKAAGWCDVIDIPNASLQDILSAFQKYRDRIVAFHYGGHATSYQLLLEAANGELQAIHADGFAGFLSQQQNLHLVFLNGCSSQGQVDRLLDAGVGGVIATREDVVDDIAVEFATAFYTSLASGVPLQTAYDEAAATLRAQLGEADTQQAWQLRIRPENHALRQWRLSDSVHKVGYAEIEERYCAQLIKYYDKLSMSGLPERNPGLSEIPLEKIFVKLGIQIQEQPVESEVRRRAAEKLGRFGTLLDTNDEAEREEEDKFLRQLRNREAHRQPQIVSLSVAEAIQRYRQLVILGGPGAGKTTLTRWLTVIFASKQQDQAEALGQHFHQPRLPLLLELRRFADRFKQHSQQPTTPDLVSEIASYIEQDARYGKPPTAFIRQALDEGRCLLLLDGVDEIADAGAREALSRSIQAFFLDGDHDHRQNLCVVTSRPHGYQDGTLAAGFQRCEVAPFTSEDVKSFIEHWYATAYGDEDAEDAQELVSAIEANTNVGQLATNPLLCTIIAIVYRNNRVLPNRRVELYLKCCEALLDTWERTKNIRESGLIGKYDWQTKLDLLAPLAYWLHSERERLSATEAEFVEQLAKVLLSKGQAPNEIAAREEARRFLTAIRDRSGLLQGRGDGSLEFMHRTFQEYLTARYIADQTYPDYIDLVMEHLHEAWWREVHLLVIGYLGSGSSGAEKSSALLETILKYPQQPWWLLLPLAHEALVPIWLRRFMERYATLGGLTIVAFSPFLLHLLFARLFHRWQTNRRLAWTLHREFTIALQGYLDCSPLGIRQSITVSLRQQAQKLLLRSLYDETINQDLFNRLAESSVSFGKIDSKEIQQLVDALNDASSDVRSRAVKALGKLAPNSPELVERLLAFIGNSQDNALHEAVDVLAELGTNSPDVVRHLLNLLGNKESYTRHVAAELLSKLGVNSLEVVELLLIALGDSQGLVRSGAAIALGKLGKSSSEMINRLVALLDDSDWNVRYEAVVALGELRVNTPEVVDRLLGMLSDSELSIQYVSVDALGKLGISTPKVIDHLLVALGSNSWSVKSAAAEALGKLKASTPKVRDALLVALSSSKSDVRYAAAEALERLEISTPEAVDRLLAALSKSERYERNVVAEVLGNLGLNTGDIVERLWSLMNEGEDDVRGAAAYTLARLGKTMPDAVDRLLVAFYDDNGTVQHDIVVALGETGRVLPNVVEQLRSALSDSNASIRLAATEALSKLGVNSPDVMDCLVTLLSDREWEVRRAAVEVLGKMRTDSPKVVNRLLWTLHDNSGYVTRHLQQQVYALGGRASSVRSAVAEALGNCIIKDEVLWKRVIQSLHRELYGFKNPRDVSLQSLKKLLDGRRLPGETWVPLRQRQQRRQALQRTAHWVVLVAGALLVAYGLAFLDQGNMVMKVITVLGGIIGIGAGVAQIVGKSLRNPWE